MIDEVFVRRRLESAGKTLAMFPRGFGKPQGHRSAWPEVLKEMIVFVNDEGDGLEIIMPELEKIKFKPSLREMTELETVLDWMVVLSNYCKNKRIPYVAKAIWLGMLHHPLTGKRIYSWRRLARKFHVSAPTPQNWYEDGVSIITRLLINQPPPQNFTAQGVSSVRGRKPYLERIDAGRKLPKPKE